MDTIKTYFNRFRKLSSVSGDRSNSRSPKRRKKDGLTRNGSLNENLTKSYPNGDTSCAIQLLRERASDTLVKNDSGENMYRSNGISFRGRVAGSKPSKDQSAMSTSLSGPGVSIPRRRDKTPPPAKPPRKDKVFSVSFECENGKELGLVLDSVPAASVDSSPRARLCSEGAIEQGLSPLASYSSHVVRVAFIKSGSPAHVDGQVRVHDEVVDINGWNMMKENTGSAR